MAFVEEFAHNVLTAVQQVTWANNLFETNDISEEEYSEIIMKNQARLEIVEFEIVGKIRINSFQEYRIALEQELGLVRDMVIQMSLRDQRKLIQINMRMVDVIQNVIKRIKKIGK